ncbi:gamma-glutamyl-gamma-aminobutyrate hydrolase family protein [Pseudomonas fluorescens]|uniref:gamma-glutamyl-gamma-aminobutyrate hydrolase family protein n=1 Tax=Pseudomonas fluorescens TaxID=294 RepID=UPI0012422758|nr:gamma-glutamyl-gamma-aminobutyrate hydrolase family protein [Pseudomonas fluorescens]
MSRLPLIGITDCSRQNGLHAYHISGDIHVSAAACKASGLSAILASLADRPSPSVILDGPDGTPITVTPFNIEPIHNSGSAFVQGSALDSARPVFAGLSGQNTIACRRHAFQRDADASNIA